VSITADLDGAPFTAPIESCGDNCQQRCQQFVLGEGLVTLHGSATDSMGATATSSRSYTVVPNQPPAVTSLNTDYLVVGQPTRLTASVSDERQPLAWADFRADGVLIQRVSSPSYSASVSYTAADAGTTLLSVEAMDRLGLSAPLFQKNVPVYPAGTGATCAVPLPLRPESTWVNPQSPSVSNQCGSDTYPGNWTQLPFDGPVVQLSISAPYAVAVHEGCGPSSGRGCFYFGATLSNLSASARLFVFRSGTVTFNSARLGLGAKCDPASTRFICDFGGCVADGSGQNRCQSTPCSDSVDNDQDGLVDYPNDPGCTSPADNDEADPGPSEVQCNNGLDDDGDGLIDSPADPTCVDPLLDGEQICSDPVAGRMGLLVPFDVSGDTRGGASRFGTCYGSNLGPEQVYEWAPPADGQYRFRIVSGGYDTVLYLQYRTCDGPLIICNDDFAGTLSQVEANLRKWVPIAIVVDGYNGGSGPYTLRVSKVNGEAPLCTGGRDEDLDGLIDCDDPDCATSTDCGGTGP